MGGKETRKEPRSTHRFGLSGQVAGRQCWGEQECSVLDLINNASST